MPTADLNGTRIFFDELGDGEPLVLLNGIMMTTQSWARLAALLAKHYRVILHDFRGQLRSLDDAGPFRMEQHAEDLAALLDHLGIERAHLVGTSYGGEVGMMFALAYPERVRGLTAIACASHVEPDLRQRVATWAATARLAPEQLYEVTAPDNFSPAFLARQPGLVKDGAARLAEYPPVFFPAFANLCEAFLELDITPRLAEITCPTLVICGGADVLKPPHYSRLIAERIPDAEMHLVAGAGHAVVVENADVITSRVISFLHGAGSR